MKKECSHIKSVAMIGVFWVANLFPMFSLAQNKALSSAGIFTSMFSAIQNIKTLRANISTDERIDGHINHAHFAIKLIGSPY